ncbi:BTB/POZ domain-containing protein 6-A, partial [Aphelenchoides avenae]
MSNYADRPVNDRMKAFFLSEDMADIYFKVGIDDAKERIPAYKVLLATASEVFHGMLYGHFDVPETIDVDDATPEAFKVVLSYIYTDTVNLTPECAFPVLYLAKKYLLNNLIATASAYVTTAYDSENVAKVLKHLDLVDEEHSETVWEAIERHAETLLRSPEFLGISHAILCDLLHRDLKASEVTIYESALAWTRAECERKQLPFAENARNVLANALNFIRFPLMSIEEFTNGPANSGLLSDQ